MFNVIEQTNTVVLPSRRPPLPVTPPVVSLCHFCSPGGCVMALIRIPLTADGVEHFS